MMGITFALLVASHWFVVCVTAFGSAGFSGTNEYDACVRLFPSGHGVSAQATTAPYVLDVSATTYIPGGTITVTLRSTDSSNFKGFILQARRTSDMAKVGSFATAANSKQNCASNGGKTLSHSSSGDKSTIVAVWTAPGTGHGSVQFLFTVVKVKVTFWTNITSATITEGSLPPGVTLAPTAAPTAAPTNVPASSPIPEIDTSGCGRSKGCYRDPEECTTCDVIVTWTKNGDDKLDIELQGIVKHAEAYVALGLSLDAKMSDDSVMDCVYSTDNTGVQMSYNGQYANDVLTDKSLGLVSGTGTIHYSDGKLVCRFTRYISLSQRRKRATDATKVYDVNAAYYLLVAKGESIFGFKGAHDVKIISPVTVNMATSYANIGGSTGFPLVKAHAVMMTLAWMVSASVAVLMPRYCKNAWPGKECLGKPIWFQLHMPLMISTLILTVIAFILIFISVGGYAQYPDYPEKVHPPLGIITTALVIINPIMAAFRPSPKAEKRPIFNKCHFAVGLLAHICAVITIFLGLYMSKAGAPSWGIWVMVGYIFWHVAVEIGLAVHMRCGTRSVSGEKISPDKKVADGSLVQTVLVAVHFVGVLILALALIIPIALG